jgi:hypothetical protein
MEDAMELVAAIVVLAMIILYYLQTAVIARYEGRSWFGEFRSFLR